LLLRVPYCKLYDLGYTSIGLQDDTIPNPRLRTVDGVYLPAHRLTNGSEERLGRQRSPKF
jgi:FAD synthetase